uniref:TAZ-type domain-containing protein n=1 Tax=Globisporangium ultimum (strain ATCC 200006 / CBS 805.95 / DAOM BR144) TaxID=431595 RepID=K3WGR0_GLOUD
MADFSEASSLGGGDYIQSLMTKKKTDFNAQKKFEESIELAYAIVEASFCSSAKAPRCLLQCQKILDHLQHHLDLKVCEAVMCTTVEFHFAHLSVCKEEQQDDKCEYCLRVKEREFTRALDMMESEQREAEAKVQAVINAMTASFANDSREEREVAMIQLEDELEQAEEYKRDMASKLETARQDLREVRERMEQLPDPVPTSVFQKLPVHFVKVAKKEQQHHAAKRRKASWMS